jgi:glycine/D-amino acid oxidase-like deaminating enzyme/nitrite reductase/ring-hydroxylating ferredoxin subunit
MEHQPIWRAKTHERASFQPLQTHLETDVAIVGGGITGLTTALRLADEGLRVAVLEAHEIGSGTSGYSTGNLYGTVDQHLAPLRDKWDEGVVRSVVEGRMQAIALVEETVMRLGIDCQFERRPWYLCAEGKAEAEWLELELAAAKAAGLEATLVESAPLPFPVRRALRLDKQAQFNPYAYLQGVARAACAGDCDIYEQTKVVDIDPEAGVTETERAKVRATHIVLATHTPKGLNLIQTELGPYREYGIAARLKAGNYPDGAFWLLGQSRSIRSYRYEGQDYLLLVGEKHKTGHHHDAPHYYQVLEAYLRERFDVAAVDYRWSAQQYRPADALPYIGRSGHENVYMGTGYAADGLVYGSLAGMIISDLILGRDNRWSELFDPHRFTPLKSAKRLVKENFHVASHLLKDYVGGAEADTVEEVPRGEGRIVALDGEKLAVYRSPDNKLSVLSPVCPHMKCMVHFNAAETSWDCPCHGSRFRTDGSVIEGPAYQGLEPRAPRQ